MSAATQEGIYLATFANKAVGPKGPNRLTAFQVQLALISRKEQHDDGESFVDIVSEDLTHQEDLFIEQKDGKLNDINIRNLKSSTSWDGKDPFWLEDDMPADTVVQVDLRMDEPKDPKYKSKLRIKFLNHKDFEGIGHIVKASEAERAEIKKKLRAKLAAISGGSASPPVPAGKPTLPAKKTPPAAKKPTSTEQDAYDAFCKALDGQPEDKVNAEWLRIIAELVPGKNGDAFTPEEWGVVAAQAADKYVPF